MTMFLSTQAIRSKFLNYFTEKKHTQVKSSSLIPGNDPTLLFVNAGMVQFKDIFLGAEQRAYQRAVSSQRCVRAGGKHNDLDQVGYTARHHTFFEMLGNFSFGDYFKKEAIAMAWEFLTVELQLPKEKLWVTVFEEDAEAEQIWLNDIGVSKARFSRIGAKDNFWQMGETGPCGPCSEIFYDHGEAIAGGPPGTPEEDGDRYVEIWNLVFMQYDRQADGSLQALPKPCVDTGMGLERLASILQGKHNNYDIDLFQHLIQYAANLIGCKDLQNPSLKVIADHIRTCAFLIADGVLPSNEGRGYVLRRVIRRAARHGHKLGADGLFFHHMLKPLIEIMGEDYPELLECRQQIAESLEKEEQKFAETLDLGMQEFNKMSADLSSGSMLSGAIAFKLYDTYGFPLDLTQDVARERGQEVDIKGFENLMEQQQQRSRSHQHFAQTSQLSAEIIEQLQASIFSGYEQFEDHSKVSVIIKDGQLIDSLKAGEKAIVITENTPFYAESGGQIGDRGTIKNQHFQATVTDTTKAAGQFHLHHVSVTQGQLQSGEQVQLQIDQQFRQNIIFNHSATHLLHQALRDILGQHVQQKGSLVAADRLRFDFSHERPIDDAALQKIEQQVNQSIRTNYPTTIKQMAFDQAVASGAMALFGEKYGDEVRVVDFGGYSVELCGGTHVKSTGDVGLFKITEESAVASGIRRIEAVTGAAAIQLIQQQEKLIKKLSKQLKARPEELLDTLQKLSTKNKQLNAELEQLQQQKAANEMQDIFASITEHQDTHYLSHVFADADMTILRTHIDDFKNQYPKGVVIFANMLGDKSQVMVGVGKQLSKKLKAGDLIKTILQPIGGRGGGRPDFAQGGGQADVTTLTRIIAEQITALQKAPI